MAVVLPVVVTHEYSKVKLPLPVKVYVGNQPLFVIISPLANHVKVAITLPLVWLVVEYSIAAA